MMNKARLGQASAPYLPNVVNSNSQIFSKPSDPKAFICKSFFFKLPFFLNIVSPIFTSRPTKSHLRRNQIKFPKSSQTFLPKNSSTSYKGSGLIVLQSSRAFSSDSTLHGLVWTFTICILSDSLPAHVFGHYFSCLFLASWPAALSSVSQDM